MRIKFGILFSLILFSFSALAQDDWKVKGLEINGALRFNYYVKSWDINNQKRGGNLDYEMFRLNFKYKKGPFSMSFQPRLYTSDFGGILLHHAWLGYDLNKDSKLIFGVSKVPFGLLPYTSHNWFFNTQYYLGLEDDYDLGIKYMLDKGKWNVQAAFYKNSELPAHNFARYSYDVTDTHGEVNQFNARVAYTPTDELDVGLSGQYGQLENQTTHAKGYHQAYAVHFARKFKTVDLLLQASYIDHQPDDEITDLVIMSAYDAPYEVASTGYVYSASIQKSLNFKKESLVSQVNFYYNFSYFDKEESAFFATEANIIGSSVSIGNLFIYIDYAMGINHPWLGPAYTDALSKGTSSRKMHSRFNVNVGYYF